MFKKILETVEVYKNLLCPKTLDAQGFTPSGGGASKSLRGLDAKRQSFLSKEVSRLVSKEEFRHVEGETRNISKTSDFIDIEILRSAQNDESYNVTNLLTYSPINLFTKRRVAFTLAEGATHVDISHNCRRIAFTLAEVLITLGIIGVVAALTLPTLIQNHQKQTYVTGIKKAYNIISNLYTKMATYEGVVSWKDLSCSDLGTYDCGAYTSGNPNDAYNLNMNSCIDSIKSNLKTIKIDEDRSADSYLSSDQVGMTIYTPDGMIYEIPITTTAYSGNTLTISYIRADTNGEKGPNLYGRDRFYLYLDYEKNKVTAYPYSSSSNCTTEKVQKGRASSCLTKIIEDGWKMNY